MPVIRFDVEEKATSLDAPVTHKVTANKTPILAGGNDADPIDSMATVSQYLADRYGESARGVNRNYETVAKDYGLSGNPLTDVKTIRAGQLDIEERQSTTIRKGLARVSAPEPQGLIANIKSSLDRGFLATGLGMPAQAFSKAYDSRKDPYATKDAPNAVIVDDGAGGVNLITSNKVTIGERKELNRIKAEIEGQGARVSVIEREPDEVSMFDPEQIRQWREEVEARNYVDPEFQQSLAGQITEGFGQAGAMIPMAALGLPAALANSFGMAYQAGEDRYRETAEAKGFAYDEAAAREAGVKGLPAGFVDAVADRFVVGKILKPLKGAGKTKSELIRLLGNGLQAGVVGAGTEGLQTAYENVNAKYLSRFDADAEIPDGVIDSMIVGFAVDAGMATGGGTVKVGADKALRRWFDPVDGMSDQDMAAAQSTAKPDEISDFAEKKYGDQVDEEGTPLKDLAVDAANGDKSARDKLRNAETVEADQTDVEAGLTPEEVEAVEFGGMEALPIEVQAEQDKRQEAEERADAIELGMESMKDHLSSLPNLTDRLTIEDAREKMASFQVELNDMLDAGVDPAEVQRFAEAAIRAAGYDPADPRYAPNRMQIKGRQISAYEKGILKATVQIFKDATPFTLSEEVEHAYYDFAIESNENSVGEIRGWKSEMQDQNPDAPKFDDSDKGVKEWIAYEANAWAAGDYGNDMSALPEGFRRYVEKFLEFAKDVMNFVRRGAELREMAEAGMLPDGMQQFMERSMGMDTDYLLSSIRDAEARATAPDPKTELREFLKTAKVPRPDSDPTYRDELEKYFEGIDKDWKRMRKDGGDLDGLAESLKEAGFNVDTPADVLDLLDRSSRGVDIYPNEDSRSAAEATDASYSMAPVNTDSPEFKAWFGDSKVVDENGDPLVVYHGTASEFEAFDLRHSGKVHSYGRHALFFITDEATAERYSKVARGESRVIPAYVKIENPLMRSAGDRLGAIESYDDGISNDVFSVQADGHDGVIIDYPGGKLVVAFDPTQIKSATSNTGAFDPQDPRISYSMAPAEKNLVAVHNLSEENLEFTMNELGALPAPSIAVVRTDIGDFSSFGEITLIAPPDRIDPATSRTHNVWNADAYTPRFPSVVHQIDRKARGKFLDDMSDEMELFDINEHRLIGDFEYSGFERLYDSPVVALKYLKSIGKTQKVIYEKRAGKPDEVIRKFAKKGIRSMDLVGDPKFIKAVEAQKRALVAKIKEKSPDRGELYEELYFDKNGELNPEAVRQEAAVVAAYSAPRSVAKHSMMTAMRKKYKESDLREWVKKEYGDLEKSKRIPAGHTPMGDRKYLPFNLGTIVKLMSKDLVAGENFNYGISTVRAASSKKFKNLKEIQKDRDKIITKEEMESLKEDIEVEFNEVKDALEPFYKHDYMSEESVVNALMGLTPSGDRSDWSYNFEGVSDEAMAKTRGFLEMLRNAATEYFEVKITDSVPISDFSTAVVPKTASKKTKDTLKAQGVKIRLYDPNIEGDRLRVVAESSAQANASFSMAPMDDVVYDEGEKQYPIASRNVWWGNANFESAGATLEYMSPDEFLKRAKPLDMDEETLENVSDIVDHIKSGRSLDPLSLYREDIADVRASDGRHRALASKELGIQEVPVLVFPDTASFSMAPMEEGESVTSRDRTPEENELAKALADWREDMTTAERKKASDRLKVLQVKAVESRKRQRLIKSAEGKYEKLFNQKTAQLRKQAEERTNLTEAVKEMETLINNPKIPTAVRGRLRGYGKLAEKKTDAGKARWLKIMANRLDSEFVKYRRTENRNKLLKFLSPYSTVYAPKLRKLSARVGEESRDLLRFAADLSRNSEAPAPKGMSEAAEFAMRETFGGVLTREASPEKIDMALKSAGAIAKGGRTEMEDFHKARKARIEDRNEQIKEAVLLGEDALDEDEIQRARDTMTTGEKVRSTMMGLLFHPLNGLQQMMNILDVRKGGFMEREFMSAAHEANQEEVAMNVDNAKRTTDDIVGIFKGENRVADGWFKDAQNVVQTEIEWDAGKGKRKRKLSKLQGVSIYMQWLDLSLRPTFENMGIDGETMAKVVEFIGQDGVKLGEYYRARYAETGIDIQGVHKETEGFAMDLVDGYGGRARRAGVAKGEDDVMLAMGGKNSRASVKSGSMKERTGNTLPLLFADASVEFNQHMREANHYISHAQLTKDLQSAFKFDKDVSNAIKQVHGDEFYSSLIKKVDGIIEGGTKAKNIVERSMNTVRANLTKASLGLKPSIAIKQLTSAPAFIEEIGFTDYAKASATMARNPLKWMKLVYGTDYVKNRTNTSIYADIQQQLAMRSNMFRGATMSDMMMMNVKYGDVGGVVLGGTPVYIDTYQKAIADGMTEANAHKEAERVFGEASERAQQSSAEFSKGEYLSGQGVMRSFFMYLTSPIQYQRNINVALLNLANSVINSRAGKEADVQTARKQAVRAVIVYHFILPQIFQAVASGLTAFTSDDDEIVDQFWRRQARAAILGNLSTFPVLGQIMSGLANEISGADEFFRSSGSPVVDFSGQAGADILRAFKSGGETEDVVKVIEDAASLKGIPLKTGLDYAESLSELDDSDHPMLKILGWSDWAIGE